MQNLEARVAKLEVDLAHQQRLCEQLNEVVTLQTQQLMRLEKSLPQLQEHVLELRSELRTRNAPGDERPPHY
jgi:SlyX protein